MIGSCVVCEREGKEFECPVDDPTVMTQHLETEHNIKVSNFKVKDKSELHY